MKDTEPRDTTTELPEPPAPVTWSDFCHAKNRTDNGGYQLGADIVEVTTVQRAMRAAIDALDLLGLEIGIVKADRDARSSEKSAAVSRQIADDLRKVRDRVYREGDQR